LVIEWEVLEATRFLKLVGFISTLGFTVTEVLELDAVSIGTLELVLEAATLLIIVELEVLEAA
jgi:hypothetical protein